MLPFLISAETISGLLPVCEWKLKYDHPCPFCGMTTSLFLISSGEFANAFAANSISAWIYPLFALNTALVICFLGKEVFTVLRNTIKKKEGIN